jgi:hypothetical protein
VYNMTTRCTGRRGPDPLVVSRHPEGNPYRFAVWRVQGNRRGREVRVVTRYELD